MLTMKIYWPSDFPNYSVYSVSKYVASKLQDGTWALYLTDPTHPDAREVLLGKGAKAYIMNGNGATVDTIIN
jgi:hypothetical protein